MLVVRPSLCNHESVVVMEQCGVLPRAYSFLFFFQAEDGIRDLVRSRGLGDVYKRQGHIPPALNDAQLAAGLNDPVFDLVAWPSLQSHCPVSYTHLTLPTSDLV